jgi:hypothetical protein
VSARDDAPGPGELAHAGLRGVIAAMAMSGMRAGTMSLRPVDRGALASDHLLYGLVLSETRSRPRE